MLKNGGNINHSDQGIASLCSAFPKGGGLKGKKPYAAHKFFCFSSLSLESVLSVFGVKTKNRAIARLFPFCGEGGIRTPGTLTSSAV